MNNRLPRNWIWLWLWVVLVAGCQAPPMDIDTERFERHETLDAAPTLTASQVFQPREWQWEYAIVGGEGAGETSHRRRYPVDRFDAAWADAEDDSRTQYVSIDDSGNVIMHATIDHDESAISLFDPPLTLAYASMKPGEVREETVNIRIVDANRPERERESGTAERRLEYVGQQRITTPVGTFDAIRLDMTLLVRLKMARARNETSVYIVPDLGIIAEESEERIRILGVFERSKQRTIALTDHGTSKPEEKP